MILIAYRQRGSLAWTHRFTITADQWRALYRQARRLRASAAYAVVRPTGYVSVV